MTRRQRLEAAIEHAIAMLDTLDGDAEAEPEPVEEGGDDELSVQWPVWNRTAA